MTTKAEKDAAEAAAKSAAEQKDAGDTTPRPTGKNAEQDAEISALKALIEQQGEQIAALTAALSTKPAAKPVPGVLSNEEASEAVKAARSKEPKTYRATQDGTDINQGFIRAGTVFSTTQPQGSWMEPVDD